MDFKGIVLIALAKAIFPELYVYTVQAGENATQCCTCSLSKIMLYQTMYQCTFC